MLLGMGLFAFLAVAVAILIRTWCDTAFLTWFDVAWLPLLFVVSAFAFAPATLGYAWLARRCPLVPLNTILLLTFAAFTGACSLLGGSKWAIFSAILVLSVVSPLVNVVCWSVVLERLSSRQARRLIPLVGGSSTAGAVGGGGLAALLIEHSGTGALLWAVVGILLLMLPLPRFVAGSWSMGRHESAESQTTFREGLQALVGNKLLRVVGAATFLMAVTTNLVDFMLKAHLQANLTPEQIGMFFANFHSITNLAVLVVQLLIVTPVIDRIGIGPSFALHPLLVLVGALACVVFPVLAMVAVLRGLDTMLKFTFQANTQNMVITPVPLLERTQAKVFLKGMIYPLGGLAAGAILTVVAQFWDSTSAAVPAIAAALSVVWLIAATRVRDTYRGQLEENLLVEVRPGLTGEATSPDELRQALRAHLSALSTLHERAKDDVARAEIRRRLEDFFLAFGLLVGDSDGVSDTADRFRMGDDKSRSDAVELLDALCRDQGINDAGTVLEMLAEQPSLVIEIDAA